MVGNLANFEFRISDSNLSKNQKDLRTSLTAGASALIKGPDLVLVQASDKLKM